MDIATNGRHRRFSTIYIKHNSFHQSKLERDVELQNTHFVLFKSPRDAHQVATLIVQLGFVSALVDWYRDATSVPFGHLLTVLSPRTDDRLRYCTKGRNIPSKFYVPDKLKHLKYMDIELTKSLYSPSIPALFPRKQNSVFKKVSKRSYPISEPVHRQPAARKLVRSKKKSRPKVQRRFSRAFFEKNNLEATKKSPFVAKKIIAQKNNFPSSSIIFFLEMEQFVLVPLSVYNSSKNSTIVTEQELPKYKPEKTPTYHKDTFKKEINQQLSTSVFPLVNKILEYPGIKL